MLAEANTSNKERELMQHCLFSNSVGKSPVQIMEYSVH